MRKKKPLVSIIIPTYKRPKKLKRAIKSCLSQTYENIEIIVVNDDPEKDVREQLNYLLEDSRIKILNHEKNKGGSGARNTGINHARGKYISFLDDDDFFLPQKIDKAVSLMEKLNDDWVGAYSWSYSESGKIRKSFIEGDFTLEFLSLNPDLNIGGTSSLFLRTNTVKSVNGFDESFERHQEWEFLVRILEEGKIKLIKEPLFVKGRNEGWYFSAEDHLKLDIKFLTKFKDIIESQGEKKKIIISAFYLHLGRHFIEEGKWIKGLRYTKKSFKLSVSYEKIKKSKKILLSIMKGLVRSQI